MRSRSRRLSIRVLIILMAACTYARSDANTNRESDEFKRINSAANVLNEIMAAPDKGIPQDVLASAKCVAVVPSMIKRGLCCRWQIRQGSSHLSDSQRLECPCPVYRDRRKLGPAVWWGSR